MRLLASCSIVLAMSLANCSDEKPAGNPKKTERSNQQIQEPTATPAQTHPGPTVAFDKEVMGSFDNPWAIEFEPDSDRLFITHRNGRVSIRLADGRIGKVDNIPEVETLSQGGLGDLVFAPDYETSSNIFLSWVERDANGRKGGVVGQAKLVCANELNCSLKNMEPIWLQSPKTRDQGHYSLRMAPSPDGQFLFVSSGDRRERMEAQNDWNNLGSILRVDLTGASDPEIWTIGHRNALGIAFDLEGKLWAVEHGPVGGDELNLIAKGANYGWPLVSDGSHYNGDPIPPSSSRTDFALPKADWTPVIAPSDMIVYKGDLFNGWDGNALISGLRSRSIIRVAIDGETAREISRFPMGDRMRSIAQANDGTIWTIEEGKEAKLFRLTPSSMSND